MGRLKNKVCIVTGGAKGLGLVYVRALLNEGAQVIAIDIADGSEVEATGATFIHADISNSAGVDRAAGVILDRFGKIDALVNNAAIYASLPPARYDEITPELFDQVLSTNVGGTWRMIRAIGPIMERQGHGKIVNITSGTVYKGLPNMLHYIASKGAVAAMTRALSRELGDHGVCVNSLAPGLTLSSSILENTDHLDKTRDKVIASRALKRDGLPEDLVGALIFLCSDESNFVTGQTLVVDGGSVNS